MVSDADGPNDCRLPNWWRVGLTEKSMNIPCVSVCVAFDHVKTGKLQNNTPKCTQGKVAQKILDIPSGYLT
jgi:hypothetical protein